MIVIGTLLIKFRGLKGASDALSGSAFFAGKASSVSIRKALVILIAADLIAVPASFASSGQGDEVTKIERPGPSETGRKIGLILETEDEAFPVMISVAPRRFDVTEQAALLEEAEEELVGAMGGKRSFEISEDLELPETLSDGAVRAMYRSEKPDILSYKGQVGGNVPEGGERVTFYATLAIGDLRSEVRFEIIVMPFDADRANADRIPRAVTGDETAADVTLPEEINGKKVRFRLKKDDAGIYVLLMGAAAASFVVAHEAGERKKKDEEKKRALLAEYPGIAFRLSLCLSAGMSVKRAALCVAGNGGSPAKEKLKKALEQTEKGLPEEEGYRVFGRECGLPCYRALGALLAECLGKGTEQLPLILEKEAERMWDERLREAKGEGEKTSLGMVAPTVLMLVIVMIIFAAPSFIGIM